MAKQDKKQIRQNFRDTCLKRDKYACRGCHKVFGVSNSSELDVHHITDRDDMPNGGYVAENGISLCAECHKKAEHFHMHGVSLPGYAPEELYAKIGSSEAAAFKLSKIL